MKCRSIGLAVILFSVSILINLFLPDGVVIFIESVLLIIAGIFLICR